MTEPGMNLGPAASYADWINAPVAAREFYVRHACEECAARGLGQADPAVVARFLGELWADRPVCRTLSLSVAFGVCFRRAVAR